MVVFFLPTNKRRRNLFAPESESVGSKDLRTLEILVSVNPGRHEAATFFLHTGSLARKKKRRAKNPAWQLASVGNWWRHYWWTSLAISRAGFGSDRRHLFAGLKQTYT